MKNKNGFDIVGLTLFSVGFILLLWSIHKFYGLGPLCVGGSIAAIIIGFFMMQIE